MQPTSKILALLVSQRSSRRAGTNPRSFQRPATTSLETADNDATWSQSSCGGQPLFREHFLNWWNVLRTPELIIPTTPAFTTGPTSSGAKRYEKETKAVGRRCSPRPLVCTRRRARRTHHAHLHHTHTHSHHTPHVPFTPHLSSCTSAKFTQRNVVHAVRLPKNTEGCAEKSGAKKKGRRDKHVCPEVPQCDGCCDAGRFFFWPRQRSSGPSVAILVFSPPCRALLFVSSPPEARGAHACAFASGSRRYSGWEGWADNPPATPPAQGPTQASDERVTTALHAVQDSLQQTTVPFPATLSEQSTLKKRECSIRGLGGPHSSARRTRRRGEALPRAEVRRGIRGRDIVQRYHRGHH